MTAADILVEIDLSINRVRLAALRGDPTQYDHEYEIMERTLCALRKWLRSEQFAHKSQAGRRI